MTQRATQRPAAIRKPEHWSNPPVPSPSPPTPGPEPHGLSPTRYGDWERNGIAVDF
jgi:hypothetical protein